MALDYLHRILDYITTQLSFPGMLGAGSLFDRSLDPRDIFYRGRVNCTFENTRFFPTVCTLPHRTATDSTRLKSKRDTLAENPSKNLWRQNDSGITDCDLSEVHDLRLSTDENRRLCHNYNYVHLVMAVEYEIGRIEPPSWKEARKGTKRRGYERRKEVEEVAHKNASCQDSRRSYFSKCGLEHGSVMANRYLLCAQMPYRGK